MARILLGLLGFFLSGGLAQTQEPAGKSPDPLEGLIQKLGSDVPAEREEAMGSLRKMGARAAPRLRRELQAVQDGEVRIRLETLLSDLALFDSTTFFEGRLGERRRRLEEGGGTPETERAVHSALLWLARHQSPDGAWSAVGFGTGCGTPACDGPGEKDYDLGLTGLALLAFLGSGYSPLSKDVYSDPVKGGEAVLFGPCVDRGLKRLIEIQSPDGGIGSGTRRFVYNHALATLALCEAYAITRTAGLQEPARKAVDFLVAAQNPGRAWRYTPRCGDNDSSATGWAVMALRTAQFASLEVRRQVFDDALRWFEDVSEQDVYGRVGYTFRGTGKVYAPGKNESFDDHPTLTGFALSARLSLGVRKGDLPSESAALVLADPPKETPKEIDYHYWFHGAQAVYQFEGPGGEGWKRWNHALKKALVPTQKTAKDGCASGSWDPSVDRWGFAGGRVYATAINALTLETYYRYPLFAARK
ncbi:MAG TPA: hypothetical protein VEN81_04975 [Planctomycetota bacterium]|nr:hypothetical protein [Planctomycetota bacterium]